MKHEFTDTQLRQAVAHFLEDAEVDLNISALDESFWTPQVKAFRKMLEALPDPVTNEADEWQECEFAEVKDTDEAVLLVFHDGAKIQGNPYLRTADQINIWVGNVSFHISILDTTKGKARIYRIPAPVQHPDPAEHPVILIREAVVKHDPPVVAIAMRERVCDELIYVFGEYGALPPTKITSWSPAKVVEDDR